MRSKIIGLLLLPVLLGLSSKASAQTFSYPIPADGKSYTLTFNPGTSSAAILQVYYEVRGNQTQVHGAGFRSALGTRGRMALVVMKSREKAAAAAARISQGIVQEFYLADGKTAKEVKVAAENFEVGAGGALLVRKDTCGWKSNAKQLMVLELRFDQVDAATLAAGFQMEVGTQVGTYRGSRIASIKPVSDGKYAPRPLLLIHTISGGSDLVTLSSWARSKLRSSRPLKVEDLVYWRGFVLNRIVAANILRGGKATVDVFNGAAAYSACITLRRTRQRVNGYPG